MLGESSLSERTDREGSGSIRFRRIWFEDKEGKKLSCAFSGRDVQVCLEYETRHEVPTAELEAAIAIYSPTGFCISEISSNYSGQKLGQSRSGVGLIRCLLPRLPLNRGAYPINIIAQAGPEVLDYVVNAGVLEVETGDFYGTGKVSSDEKRYVLLHQRWSHENNSS